MPQKVYDYVIIGSGFGGSVSAMRLTEKGYSVLVIERGKRFRDADFPKSNWNLPKYLWLPKLRLFGFFEMTFMNGLLALHGSGVGGGSLTYGNVLMEPSDELFEGWNSADWKSTLAPHYATAKHMLGVTRNPKLWPADNALKQIAGELGYADSFHATDVGVFFGHPGKEGETVPDPYFGGEGPERAGCIHCGGCMVGCRHNAKNMLTKNYLYFAEKNGADVLAETKVVDIKPETGVNSTGSRYRILYRSSTKLVKGKQAEVHARNVIVAAGALGSMELLFKCRDETRSLPKISKKLGDQVRTNSENIMGVVMRDKDVDFSEGIAITSIFQADEVTRIEPVKYSEGASFIRAMTAPFVEGDHPIWLRFVKMTGKILRHPIDFIYEKFLANWSRVTTIFLVMQTEDNLTRVRRGRNFFTLFLKGLVLKPDADYPIPKQIPVGNKVVKTYAERMNGIPQAAFTDGLFNFPTTAHFMGGVPIGHDESEGVVGLNCEMHNYPGIFVVDGSIMPGNPGVNPSLTITALAEYAMSLVEEKN
ncbi:MAG: GMC family oxidoreductase [Anaerolineae bacterium]|jgi:cholesterol oxidase|nr:GMC family oxidoreductase [Anaerolineae bacterium]MBT7071630.1 GMC family oxidoreductase [Anaerolineae bacterium]MBT7324247.1 GMC family oxidoreductase [Anaerolineae bacterium]